LNPSPLRYPGGKYKLNKFIGKLVESNNCSTYIEPFAGGSALAISLLINKKVNKIIINDIDYSIYCFWESVLYRTSELIKLIKETQVTIEEWYRQKEIRNNIHSHDPLTIGFSTFFLNRTNRSGIIDKAGPIGGLQQKGKYLIDCRFNKYDLIERILKISNYRKNISIFNMDAIDFIDEVIVKTKNSLTFFDPPYFKKGRKLYTNSYLYGDHESLAKNIKEKMNNRKWIVTYDVSDEIAKLYSDFFCCRFSLSYTLQEKKKGEEYMFFSKRIKLSSKDLELLKSGNKKKKERSK
jgi:DNA adenine methylase